MALSMDQIAGYLQQAEKITGVQLTQQELAGLLAIPTRESGNDPNAFNGNAGTGDYSIGLWQENFLGSMRGRINEITNLDPSHPSSPDALRGDALGEAIGALLLVRDSRGTGDGLSPWGGYKGMTDTYNVPKSAIDQANQMAAQIKGGSYVPTAPSGGAPGASVPGAATQAPTGGQPAGVTVKPPTDGRLIRSPWDGKLFLMYDVGGVIIDYEVPEGGGVDVSGMQEEHPDRNTFTAINAVEGGSALELNDVVRSYGTYGNFFNTILLQVMGQNNPAANDPGVRRVIAEFAGRPDMSPTELQNRLQGTAWYQGRTEAQLQWDEKPQAEKDKLKQDMASQMAQSWLQYAGVQLGSDDPMIANYVNDLASGKMSYGGWIESVVKAHAQADPESPFSRQLRDEQETRKQRPLDIENQAQQIRSTLHDWGVAWSEQTIQDWARSMTTKDLSQDDLIQTVKTQAQQLYPTKDPNMVTRDFAQPWIQTYQRVMERDIDLTNPTIQQAMSAGTSSWDFEQQLKNTDQWMGTKNFKDTISGAIASAGQKMGFVK